MFPEKTLLRWLLQEDRDPDDFLTAWDENELYKKDPKKYCEDLDEEYDPEDPYWFESEVQDVMENWEPDMKRRSMTICLRAITLRDKIQ